MPEPIDALLPAIALSDLHLDIQEEGRLSALLGGLEERLADVRQVFLLGDVVESPRDAASRGRAEAVVGRLASVIGDRPVVYLNGNHDSMFQERPFDLPLKVRQMNGPSFEVRTRRGLFRLSHGHDWDPLTPKKPSKKIMPVRLKTWLMHDVGQPAYLAAQDLGVRLFGWAMPDSWKLVNSSRTAMPLWIDDLYARRARREMATGRWAGIVHGHTHIPYVREIEGRPYVNTGDWQNHATCTIWREDGFEQVELAEFRD